LTPLAVALQGIGYLQRLVAVQGLWPTDEVVTPKPDFFPMGRIIRRRDTDDDALLFML
jgi:hypothetical protein